MQPQSPQKWLLVVLVLNLTSTLLHYTDNALFLDRYPGPDWFTPAGILAAWLLMSLLGALGYWLYTKRSFGAAYLCLGIYTITGLSSPAHYVYPSMAAMSVKMHLLIWSDAIAGLLLVGFLLWSAVGLQEWRNRAA